MNTLTKTEKLIKLLKFDDQIQLLDIGAACINELPVYLPLIQNKIAHLHAIEGDGRQVSMIKERYGQFCTVHETYVADGLNKKVYLCAPESGMTSLYKPDPKRLEYFNGFSNFGKVIEINEIKTAKLDSLPIQRVDFAKLDIQGSEHLVLSNGLEKIKNALAIRIEVSFVPLYEGQPCIGDIDLLMRSIGFVPHSFLDLKKWSIAPLVKNNNIRIPFNQLLEADIVYIKDPLNMQLWSTYELIIMVIISSICFQSYDLAARCFLELAKKDSTYEGMLSDFVSVVNDVQN